MDSAEQAALSESEHDSTGQSQSRTKRFNKVHRFTDHPSSSTGGNGKEMLIKPMRRFERLSVNLSLSSILVPSGVDLNGKQTIKPY